jgi:hypothetical protein
MYKEIYLKIRELLKGIDGIEEVNIFDDGNFNKYPAINITNITKNRARTATYMIEENGTIDLVLFQEITYNNMGFAQGNVIILNLIEAIDDIFDENSDLDGLVDDITLERASMGYVNRELNFRTYNISLSYKLLKQISNE